MTRRLGALALTALCAGILVSGQPASAASLAPIAGQGPAATPPVIAMFASPNPVAVGGIVTVSVTVGETPPAGTVQFEVGDTAIGPPVPFDSTGTASTTTTFALPGTWRISAVFTPADPNGGGGFVAAYTETVQGAASGTIPLSAPVPVTGAFTLTVDNADTVTLVGGGQAIAATTPIVVTDTRNTFPGWTVTGQASAFTGSGSAAGASISGNQLGWSPTFTGALPPGVRLGIPVNAASQGLGTTPAVLASVPAALGNGYGTATLGADLDLVIPPLQAAGPYSGALFITAADSNP